MVCTSPYPYAKSSRRYRAHFPCSTLSPRTYDRTSSVVPLANGWVAYGSSYGTPTLNLAKGLCTVQGLIKKNSAGYGHLATLPADCRPSKRLIFNLNHNQYSARVDVYTNGQVHWVAGTKSHSWLSLTVRHTYSDYDTRARAPGWRILSVFVRCHWHHFPRTEALPSTDVLSTLLLDATRATLWLSLHTVLYCFCVDITQPRLTPPLPPLSGHHIYSQYKHNCRWRRVHPNGRLALGDQKLQ